MLPPRRREPRVFFQCPYNAHANLRIDNKHNRFLKALPYSEKLSLSSIAQGRYQPNITSIAITPCPLNFLQIIDP